VLLFSRRFAESVESGNAKDFDEIDGLNVIIQYRS
jgi:hypothetical protein